MGTSTVIAIAIGTWIGIRGATHRYSLFDYLATIGAMVALSIPTFWFGLVGDLRLLAASSAGCPPATCTRSATAPFWTTCTT